MNRLTKLKPGDKVEIIAPASRCSDKSLVELKELLQSWRLNYYIDPNIFGSDLLCANSDEYRFHALKNSLLSAETKAIICARGGYGCTRLLPKLSRVMQPNLQKIFIGMSDATALNLFLLQKWKWPVLHGALTPDRFSKDSIASIKSILFDKTDTVKFIAQPLNKYAIHESVIETCITGGNLSILQTSIGTPWQIDSSNKIILIEEVGERGYRVDRMLEHLRQAKIFSKASAVIFGDFTDGAEPNGKSLIMSVLERFSAACTIPVIKIDGIGHNHTNFPIPLGTPVKLKLGNEINLNCNV